jgi:hypothetical protein
MLSNVMNDKIKDWFNKQMKDVELEKELLKNKSNDLFVDDRDYDSDYISALRLIDKLYLMRDDNKEDEHDKISQRVYRRLRLRYAQVSELEEQARLLKMNDRGNFFDEHDKINSGPSASARKYREDSKTKLDVDQRSYRLAVTDLFVEKALAYLEAEENRLKDRGHIYMKMGIMSYLFGAVFAIIILLDPCKALVHLSSTDKWTMLSNFTKSFSVLGMIVLLGVSLIRYGKSSIEQSQILFERRHALRQGRLFVHLHDGELGIDEMEKSFEWNVSLPNAFSKLPTESQAPWGSVLKETVNKIPEWIKAAGDAFSGKKMN